MKAEGIAFVPTYSTVIDLAEPGGDYDQPALILRGQAMLPRLAEVVQKAHKKGILIVTGADTSYRPNSLTRVSHEIENFVKFGMTPIEALRAATVNAAVLFKSVGYIMRLAPIGAFGAMAFTIGKTAWKVSEASPF